ncbi:MAG: sulfite exporter TauE/SafE family protein [Woeseiaceae bacterium]|nr:sulfite exporter TauE/SafE family protein [Woeseiaceae bacterium]
MISDPIFYLAAVPAVIMFGIAKGGFGSGLGVMAVPIIAMVVSPVQAAAILLPILCLMDLVGLWAYRGKWVLPELKLLLPASLVGIAIGTLSFEYMSPSRLRLLLGIVAIGFTLNHWLDTALDRSPGTKLLGTVAGTCAGAAAGFTSFIAHAGGPPITMYLLRRGINRTEFVATTVVFFAVVNYVKLIPYAWLDQLDATNLKTSLVLAPLAPVGIGMGVWLHNRVTDRLFFRIAYGMLFIVGVKLIYDGSLG